MNRKLIVLNVVLLALAGWLFWMLRLKWIELHKHEHTVLALSPAVQKRLAPPVPMQLPNRMMSVEYNEVVQRTLFAKDRNPNVIVDPPPAPPPPPPPPPMPALPAYYGSINFGDPIVLLKLYKSNLNTIANPVLMTGPGFVTKDNALKLDYRAKSDRPTVASLTNHAYFALQGEGNGDISDQMMQVFADRYTPADAGNLVTGEIAPVDGTPADFRKPVRVGDVRTSDFPQIAMRKGIELEMVINGKPGTLRPAARMTDPHTGIVMDVSTTQPCMVVYGDSIGDHTVTGKGGKIYRNFYAMSFETEGYLDAVHHPNFASTVVTPQKPMHEVTVFKFSTR